MRTVRIGVALMLALLLAGCGVTRLAINGQRIRPSGNIVTETRDVGAFHSVDLRAFGAVEIVQGEPQSLTVEGSDNIVSHVVTRVQRGVLALETDEEIYVLGDSDGSVLTFRITMPEVRALTLSGAGDIRMDSLSARDLDLTVPGAGNITIDALVADSLGISLPGLGDIVVAGRAQRA
ncbi:MAG: GIN domain-containing protein, partial [Anaerolineae bacterium]